MTGDKFVVDTNILIYLFNGDQELAKSLHMKELFVSVITEMELLSFPDLTEADRQQIKSFLKDVELIELDQEVKELAINIRSTFRLKLPDAIVLATAKNLNLPLFTADKKLDRATSVQTIIYVPS